MNYQVFFDSALIANYHRSGPHYTIYPPVSEFSEQPGQKNYCLWVSESNSELIPRPLSLFFHIPFSTTANYHDAGNNVISTDKYRLLEYLEYLKKEIELQGRLFDKDRIVQQLYWGGGIPRTLEDDGIDSLMRYLRQHFPLLESDSGEYTVEVDPHITRCNTLSILRDYGFNHLKLSVKDYYHHVRNTDSKEQTGDPVYSIIDAARRFDYKNVSVDLTYGQPLQSLEKMANTLDSILEHSPDRITLRDYTHLPDRHPSPELSCNDDKGSSNSDKIALFKYAFEKLTDAKYVYIGMEQFTQPLDSLAIAQRNGTLHRNIQGYSVQKECDLVAMGVSAISKIGNHYCQNTGDPETYRKLLDRDQLPICRGCFSSREDRIRRDIIQQLLCHGRIDIRSIERKWLLKFNHFFSKEVEILRAMARDNMVSMTDVNIQVAESGRLLIRDICMVFDQYANTPYKHGYSSARTKPY